ncbi:hypothetical protein Fot_37158 [Forsythia ovata]|uniref:Uncharacterized protein n=1 Tax=Forsythia ovata TaxID=205694 RepID=A0ABD1SRM3_9LAMI
MEMKNQEMILLELKREEEPDLLIGLPEVKRLGEDLLDSLGDESEFYTANKDLDSFMKSFEEEIMGSPSPTVDVVDLKSASEEESQPDLGYLLEACDDELGLPPSASSPASALCEGEAEWTLTRPNSVVSCGEILGFDAAEEPPSTLDVEVFDFDGPFDQSSSLGHAEINFLKHASIKNADLWVLLEGKISQSSQSKLHFRIFLDNNNGVETIRDYLVKLEKEVGKKLDIKSPHRNSMFQKIFGLPPEEFLISDFSCSLKKKMPLQREN